MNTRRFHLQRGWTAWMLPAALLLLFPLTAAAANLVSLTVNPATVVSGTPVAVTMTLDGPAPVGGARVTLSGVPAGIVTFYYPIQTIAAGATSKGTQPQTAAVATPTTVTVEASCGGVTKTAIVTVLPREPVRGVPGDLWADVVLGKPDFSEITPNQVTARTLFLPAGVTVDRSFSPNRLYVYDGGNSRVLGMSHLGTCQGLPTQTCTTNSDCDSNGPCVIQEGRGADLVLGQPSFDRSACNGDGAFQRNPRRAPASASSFCAMPELQVSVGESIPSASMFVDGGGSLYVGDAANHRVLRYNSPFTTDTVADDVWGQADFSGNECNRGASSPDAQSLCSLYAAGVTVDSGGNLWVTDFQNNRVLRFPYDAGTGSPGHVADIALGQPDFSSKGSGNTLNRLWGPAAVRVDGAGSVYVADQGNNRVLIFDPPLTTNKTANRKLNYAFHSPTGLEFDPAGGIWVNDTNNAQLLLFVGGAVQKVLFTDAADSQGKRHAGCVGDRPNFTFEADATSITSWDFILSVGSIGIDSDGNIFASGYRNDVWRFPAPIPTPTPLLAHSADARLFKPYQLWMVNEVGLARMSGPSGVAVAGNQLVVADGGRILFWDGPPNLTNGKPADGFVGAGDPGYQPPWEYFGRLREDANNHLWANRVDKIRVYSLPLHTGDTPMATIGPTLPVLGGGSITWDSVSLAIGGIAPEPTGEKVWVADPGSNRVFRIRDALTSPVVDIVLGQTTAAGTQCNQGRGQQPTSPSRTSLCNCGAVRLDPAGNLYVSDDGAEVSGNFRVLEFDAGLFPESPTKALFAIPASRVFGTAGSFTLRPCGGDYDPAEPCSNLFEPAFSSDGQMVVGGNRYQTVAFPYVYTNPLVSQLPGSFLNDWYSWPQSATFDSSNNLYVVDGNRSRVLIYLNPLSAPPPEVSTLTVTKTGGGSGTVRSTPFGIDCGTDCSQTYIDGTSVTLSTVPGTNSLFTGWSGDCADGIVTMNNNKTCTARFDLMPDLVLFALSAPAGALAGSTISITDTTKNQLGTGQAGASTTRFYFSTNSTWDAGDTMIGSRSIPTLAANTTSTGSADVAIPAGKATGTYYIIAKADADGLLTESSETNNTKYASIRISPPDLVISAISVPLTGGAGATITATNTTKNNINTSPAPASTTKFYLSTNSTWEAGDTYLQSQSVGALAPGASEAHSTGLTIPVGTTPGTNYIIAKADAEGLIPETLETNNTAYDTIVIGPDLIVSALTVPTTGGAGLPVTVTDTTKNQGGGAAPASTTNFYLSTNTTLGGDVFLGSRSVVTLNPGATSAGPTTFTIPAGTAPGSYYILAIADGPTIISETVETNNLKYALIKVSPDLVVSVLGAPTSARVGTAITVTDTTKNQGSGIAGASATKFYLSTNATWEAGDIETGVRSVPQLVYGATSAGSTSVTIPGATVPGAYYILAKADATNAVAESTETNNVTGKAITITP